MKEVEGGTAVAGSGEAGVAMSVRLMRNIGASRCFAPLFAVLVPACGADLPPEAAELASREAAAVAREFHPEASEAISKLFSPFHPPGEMLEICRNPEAAALRDSISAMAYGGLPADSIIERVLAAHGEEYRAFPKRSGRGLLAWTMPPAMLVAGLAVVVLVLRRLKGPAPVGGRAELTDEERDRLDAALAELEALEELE